MKGVHHLTDMAQELSCRKVPYKFSICGGGDLETYLRGEIQRLQLKDVQLLGNLNFTKELLPLMREQVDLFVAPHIQGDPACTYLETLACGVPIVGYANEAWSGILNRAPVGWSAPVGDPKALARVIASLEKSELAERSLAALQFAKEHSFERTYDARVRHLASCARK
jgi:glycosyltransferase involved in cell wall biosynthesis